MKEVTKGLTRSEILRERERERERERDSKGKVLSFSRVRFLCVAVCVFACKK